MEQFGGLIWDTNLGDWISVQELSFLRWAESSCASAIQNVDVTAEITNSRIGPSKRIRLPATGEPRFSSHQGVQFFGFHWLLLELDIVHFREVPLVSINQATKIDVFDCQSGTHTARGLCSWGSTLWGWRTRFHRGVQQCFDMSRFIGTWKMSRQQFRYCLCGLFARSLPGCRVGWWVRIYNWRMLVLGVKRFKLYRLFLRPLTKSEVWL